MEDIKLELKGILLNISIKKYGIYKLYIGEFFSSDATTYYILIPSISAKYYLDKLDFYKNKICKITIKGITINHITRWKLEQLS